MGDWMGMLGHPLVREENNVEIHQFPFGKGQGVPSLKTLTEAEAEVGRVRYMQWQVKYEKMAGKEQTVACFADQTSW